MPKIIKPMLAVNFDPTKAKFPYIATPKIDGIRFLMVDGQALSRTFKPIRNRYIQSLLSAHLPDGVDGELTVGNTFQSSSSGVMSIEGEPENLKVWIFDYVDPTTDFILPFWQRIAKPLDWIPLLPADHEVLGGKIIKSHDELTIYESECLEAGYEGVMLRDPEGTYKFGRATVRENILLKVKRFVDDEAEIIGFEEKMSNQNAPEKDAFGHTKRSSHLSGMVPCGTLGTLVVRNSFGQRFGIGTGLDDKTRKEIWDNREYYHGKLVKYKYFPQGIKELPRIPVFLGFRDPDDL